MDRSCPLDLEQLGWNDRLAAQFAALGRSDWRPARIVRWHGEASIVDGPSGELAARPSGKLRHETQQLGEMPALGDWVAIEPRVDEGTATIHLRLPRRSRFSRKVAGHRTDEQVVASNIDTALVMVGLDHDLSVRRIERYLTQIWNSGADAVIVLNKADLCDDVSQVVDEVEQASRGVPVAPISAATGEGVDALRPYLRVGQTVVAVGSSGVGKSTLINCLLGYDLQPTQAVRADDSHGRHTTTFGQLIPLPAGGVYIDTPGLREVQLWGDEADVDQTFADIVELAAQCRFTDCQHGSEPGCAVRAALDEGTLDAGRLDSYRRQQREMQRLAELQDSQTAANSKRRWKQIHKEIRRHYRDRDKM